MDKEVITDSTADCPATDSQTEAERKLDQLGVK